jgi:chitin-binding protein
MANGLERQMERIKNRKFLRTLSWIPSGISSGIWSIPLVLATLSFGDGLMESPPARNWYCGYLTKPDHFANNTAKYPFCAEAFAAMPMAAYNFMSVVTHSWGRAKALPLPAHVCSFDSETWNGAQTPWDTPLAWPTTPMSPGLQDITWNAAWGAHYDDTRDFSYWITKPDFVFSPDRELTWADFETEPFCVELYDDKNPEANPNLVVDKVNIKFTTKCQVPPRSGHHVIYGEWGRTESTLQRFHGCIDVAFGSVGVLGNGTRGNPQSGNTTPTAPAFHGGNSDGFRHGGAQWSPLGRLLDRETPLRPDP